MEPASAERTRRSSSRPLSRNPYTASPLRPRSSPKKRKRKSKASEEYYSVRSILGEETRDGLLSYLIDWEDNPDTGEAYAPSWEPYYNVNREAVKDWNRKRLEIQGGGAFDDRERSSTFDSDNEAFRRTKRPRISDAPIRTKPSEAGPENYPTVHAVPGDPPAEIKDTYEEEQTLSSGADKVLVLVPRVDDGFERSAYAIVPTLSSDASQASKPSQDSDYLPPSAKSINPPPSRRPFLWDEPAPAIQDSQLPGCSSYIPSEQETTPSEDTQRKPSCVSDASADQGIEYSDHLSYSPSQQPQIRPSSSHLSAKAPSRPPPTRDINRRPSQLSISFITDNSESLEESWQPAQIRSPAPPPSTELSTQAVSISEGFTGPPSTKSRNQTLVGRPPESVIQSIEKAQDISWSGKIEGQDSSGSPLPPRPTPPSYPTMAEQAISSSQNVADMFKQARANAAASTIARQAEARAASAAPTTEPSLINQMLPLRSTTETLVSPVSRNSSDSESNKALQILPLGTEEYVVPLPLNSITRDIYDVQLTNSRAQQKAFLSTERPDENLITEIDSLLGRLKELCDHQDLVRSDLSTQEIDPFDMQAAWAETISTKCVFLNSFLTFLRPFNIHVALVARPGRMVDILETILKKERCTYNRPDRPDIAPCVAEHGAMRISLFPSDFYNSNVKIEIEPASIIIAFDSTFEKERYPRILREGLLHDGSLAPLVHLTILRSIEHFELCFDKRMDPADRRRALLSCVLHSRREVGILPPGYHNPPAAATEVGMFATGMPTDRIWPLPSMPDLDGFEIYLDNAEDAERDTQRSEPLPGQAQLSESYISSAQLLQPTFKRSLSAEDDDASSKRQRRTPIIDEAPRTMNPSSISSLLNPMDVEPSQRIFEAERPPKPTVLDAEVANLISSLEAKVRELEFEGQHRDTSYAELQLELQRRDASYAALRSEYQQLESRCKGLEKSIQDMQPRYQEALNDRGRFEHDLNEATSRANTLQQRLDARVADLTKLKEEKANSDFQLAAARAELTSSTIPEVAELNRMREEVAKVQAEGERHQKRISNMQNELEYMRMNYQQASTAAGEAATELNEVRAELATAQVKASENARRIHEIQASSEMKQYLARIRELEAEKVEAERELEKKSDELKAMLNGRRATRGTSVPRSPRMGTMSPGSRPMARVLSVGSRGNSPAPGDGPPYRTTFAGEALFTTVPASSRFGNHLM